MLKNVSRLEAIVNGRTYHLYCDMESPLHEVEEALMKFSECLEQIKINAQNIDDQIPDGNIPA